MSCRTRGGGLSSRSPVMRLFRDSRRAPRSAVHDDHSRLGQRGRSAARRRSSPPPILDQTLTLSRACPSRCSLERLGRLSDDRMPEVCAALDVAVECHHDISAFRQPSQPLAPPSLKTTRAQSSFAHVTSATNHVGITRTVFRTVSVTRAPVGSCVSPRVLPDHQGPLAVGVVEISTPRTSCPW